MSILDRLKGKKVHSKRTYKEIRYDRILTAQQNMILESSLAANIALKQELKSLRAVLFSQEDLATEIKLHGEKSTESGSKSASKVSRKSKTEKVKTAEPEATDDPSDAEEDSPEPAKEVSTEA